MRSIVWISLAALSGRLTLLLSNYQSSLLRLQQGCLLSSLSLVLQIQLVLVNRSLLGSCSLGLLLLIRGFGWKTQLLIESFPELLEFGESLAQVVVFEMAARVGILEFSIWVLVDVDSLEIGEVDVVNVGIIVLGHVLLSAFQGD